MKRAPPLLLAGWALFVASWFLPVVRESGVTLVGWQACRVLLSPVWPSPHMNATGGTVASSAFLVACSVSNIVVLLSALVVWRPFVRHAGLVAVGLAVALALNLEWALPVPNHAHLLVGYWAWVLSFATTAIALHGVAPRACNREPSLVHAA